LVHEAHDIAVIAQVCQLAAKLEKEILTSTFGVVTGKIFTFLKEVHYSNRIYWIKNRVKT